VRVRLLKNTVFGNNCVGAGRVVEVEDSRYIQDQITLGRLIKTNEKVTDHRKFSSRGVSTMPRRDSR
jgi:hypothetical protein